MLANARSLFLVKIAVALYMSAWIEIIAYRDGYKPVTVALYMSAWIEIGLFISMYSSK